MRISLFIFSVLLLHACTGQSIKWSVAENEQGILIQEGADHVLFYQRAPKSHEGKYIRANYIHPLYGMSNNVLTEDFPEDHLHHRGVFWAWHQNFIGDKRVGDAWALEDFSWEIIDVNIDRYADSCVLNTAVFWKSPLWENGQESFVKEQASIKIYTGKDHYRVIDFQIELHALEDSFAIGGSENEKGYSGFSWRIPLKEGVSFEGVEGKVKPQTLAVEAGPWLNISGNLDGEGSREGVVVISHPTNPDHPQNWILRRERSMQNVVFPGRELFFIPRDRPLILRYRMIIYEGRMDMADIPELGFK